MILNEIFYEDKYEEAYNLTQSNNYTIKEIDPDERGRRFQLIEIPKPSEKLILQFEKIELEKWFDVYYMQHEQKYRRLHTLNKLTDNGESAYDKLLNLYNEAETKRQRIQEIEVKLK